MSGRSALYPLVKQAAIALLAAGLVPAGLGQPMRVGNPSSTAFGPPGSDASGGYPNPFSSRPGMNRYAGSGFSDYSPERPTLVYFPPLPPRLGEHLEPPSLLQAGRPAPAELAAYVNEPFYAPLSNRLAENSLSPRQRQRVEAYLAAKLRLQNELRSRLSEVRSADSATRQREFAALARTEDPQIDELERTAEELRADLIRGEFFQPGVQWNESRSWRLGASGFHTSLDAIAAQFLVMQNAAFFQKGLLPAERRLMREVAMELGEIPIVPPGSPGLAPGSPPTDTNPPLFFSPETSRVRLPLDLPADLADKISAYERDKSELKRELRELVYAEDTAFFSFARTHALAALAREQAGRIAALEERAEDIRRGLAALPVQPRPPEPPPVPPGLAVRIADFLEHKQDIQQSLWRLLTEARNTIQIDRVIYRKTPDGKYGLSLGVSPFNRDEAKMKKIQDDFAAFSQENTARAAALEKELASLRREAAELLGAGTDPAGQKDVNRLLSDCALAIEDRQDWRLYEDYRTAVLEPGLSPGQRRLLFDAALVDLRLPLPGLAGSPREASPGLSRYSLSPLRSTSRTPTPDSPVPAPDSPR